MIRSTAVRLRRRARAAIHAARRANFWLAHAGFLFHLPGRDASPAMTRRRRLARRLIRLLWPPALRPLAVLGSTCLWPLGALADTRAVLRDHGQAALSGGSSRWRAALGIWTTSVRHNLPPREVVEHAVHRPGGPPPDAWITAVEITQIWAHLSDGQAHRVAGDKYEFARFCRACGLAHVPTLGYWRGGEAIERAERVWPDAVLLKPVSGDNGAGIEVWRPDPSGYRRGRQCLSAAELTLRAASLSVRWRGILMQPYLGVHPCLSTPGVSGLPAARIVTGRWPDGTTCLLEATWSVPHPGRVVSNLGYKWPIELTSGRLLPPLGRTGSRWAGATLVGRSIPDWRDGVDLALRGQAAFPGRVAALGWDVAFTADGPTLLEANTGIGFQSQAARQEPAGSGPVGEFLDAWIRRNG